MKKLLFIIGITAALVSCQQEEVETEQFSECELEITNYTASMANPETGLIEGDIIPHPEVKGNAIKGDEYRWPKVDGVVIVPYVFNEGFYFREYPKQAREMFKTIGNKTGVVFKEIKNKEEMEAKYGYGLVVKSSFFGSSSVGRNPYGTQDIYFVFNPDNNITNTHEVAHALGLEHEHNRHDRDEYIVMNWENINEGRQEDYEPKERSCDFGEYDYESITHYESMGFDKIRFTRLDGSLIEKNTELSAGDIEAIKLINGIK